MAWSEPLEVLTRSLDREARLTADARRRIRDELVTLLSARAVPEGAAATRTVFVTGLPGSAADVLAAALGHAEPDAFLTGFVSLSFDLRWHVPTYAEWLAEADLAPTYQAVRDGTAAPAVLSGAFHLERLDLIGTPSGGWRAHGSRAGWFGRW